jgi:hypothetical protein
MRERSSSSAKRLYTTTCGPNYRYLCARISYLPSIGNPCSFSSSSSSPPHTPPSLSSSHHHSTLYTAARTLYLVVLAVEHRDEKTLPVSAGMSKTHARMLGMCKARNAF